MGKKLLDPASFCTNPSEETTDPPNVDNTLAPFVVGEAALLPPQCNLEPSLLHRQIPVSYSSVLYQASSLVAHLYIGTEHPFLCGPKGMVGFQASTSVTSKLEDGSSASALFGKPKVGGFQELLRSASDGVLDCMQIGNGFYGNDNISCERHLPEDLIGTGFGSCFNHGGVINQGRDEINNCQMERDFNQGLSSPGGDCFGDISESEDEGENTDVGSAGKLDTSIENDMIQSDVECAAGQTSNPIDDGNDNIGKAESADETESEDEEEIIVDAELNQEIYVDKDQKGVPYRKRKRCNGTTKRPNERNPRMIGAVKRALRSSSTRKREHIFEPMIGMVFDSREEAREFYNLYSWEVGFGVKFNNSRGTKSGTRQKNMMLTLRRITGACRILFARNQVSTIG